ncbi:MAG: AbrB/MazE/SpoVT family DNA-binding domain-containing protein [bacterium]|nr:AbrB/MazE/SpoVT family DNA-binding domain-containing protein [bacterium]
MNLAKISANGQITVPAEIRRLLGLKSGDKVLFFQKSSGEVVINNASSQAIYKAQRAFEGVAEQMGVYNDDDVQTLVDEVRIGTSKSALERDNE